MLRMMDEVIDLAGFGAALLCIAGEPRTGMRIRDARGQEHAVGSVSEQDGLYTLHLPEGDADYFGRLFRDVRVDATLFEEAE